MNYIDRIEQAIKAQYPSLIKVIGIGRQNDQGIIVIGDKEYGGISDKSDNYGYIRYRGREDWRHERAPRQISSTTTMQASAELRLVVVHREQDTSAFVEGLAGVLMGVFKNVGGVSLVVTSTDQDRNRILRDESGGESGSWNTAVGLARVDFTLTYTYTGQPCNPADLCGGGTAPTPTDCPTLCDQITVATAQQVVDCFDEVKEEAVKALICTPCPPVPNLCDLIEDATVIEIIDCLSPTQTDEIKAELCDPCPPCEPATYSNGGDFTVDIPSGDTYVADPITVTDVDGTERPSLPNIGVVCEWKELSGVDSEGQPVSNTTVSSYPAGGLIVYPDRRIQDAVGNTQSLPYRNRTRILNAALASAVNDATIEDAHNLTIEVDVPVVNSAGDTVGSKVDDLLNPHALPDIPVTDNNGAVGSYPMPTSLVIDGEVDSASYAAGTLTIVPAGGGAPTNIIPNRLVLPYSATTNGVGDLGWHWANGTFNYSDPAGIPQELDPAAGAEYFFTLKHDNAFGNKLRFTDDQGVGGITGRLDFAGDTVTPNSVGATPGYFIDHLTGNGYTQYPVANGKGYVESLALAHAFTLNGYTGFRMINEVEVLSMTVIAAFIWPFSGTNADYPFRRGGTNPLETFDPTPTGSINTAWLNRIISGRGRNMRDFRLQIIDSPLDTSANHGTFAVRKHF